MTRLFALALVLGLPLTACGSGDVAATGEAASEAGPASKDVTLAGDPTAPNPVEVRLNAGAGPSAGYFTLRGGEQANRLVGVTVRGADRVEMHETTRENGMTSMVAITSVDIPADEFVAFQPGGRHLMIWGIGDAARTAGEIEITLDIESGPDIVMTAPLRAAGAAAEDHSNH